MADALADVPSRSGGDAAPSPATHLFETDYGPHLLVVDGSQVFSIPDDLVSALEESVNLTGGSAAILGQFGIVAQGFVDHAELITPPLRTLSLSVAQACNLGCSYCYAQGGGFGGKAKAMPWSVAQSAIDRLIAGANPGDRVFLSFLGGEPTLNRRLIRRATDYALERAETRDVAVGFALTTNATLVTAEDAQFFEVHGFSVTVSLDGIGEVHDRLRPFKRGGASFQRAMDGVRHLLAAQSAMQVSARVTVTPHNLDLRETLDALVKEGFHSVGFSPMLSAPNGRDELRTADLDRMLDQMMDCGEAFLDHTKAGRRYPFSNMLMALRQIHEGTHRPYPCGAGAGYLAASADGQLFACHRFVDDELGLFGDLQHGIDRARQRDWLDDRHVNRQEPCRSCWARYLCGGGCHHEVINRGRAACDYIRGWLTFCLKAYVELSEEAPEVLGLRPS